MRVAPQELVNVAVRSTDAVREFPLVAASARASVPCRAAWHGEQKLQREVQQYGEEHHAPLQRRSALVERPAQAGEGEALHTALAAARCVELLRLARGEEGRTETTHEARAFVRARAAVLWCVRRRRRGGEVGGICCRGGGAAARNVRAAAAPRANAAHVQRRDKAGRQCIGRRSNSGAGGGARGERGHVRRTGRRKNGQGDGWDARKAQRARSRWRRARQNKTKRLTSR